MLVHNLELVNEMTLIGIPIESPRPVGSMCVTGERHRATVCKLKLNFKHSMRFGAYRMVSWETSKMKWSA